MKRSNLVRARQDAGLTQEALARQVGVIGITVSRWERGKCAPVGDSLAKLCEVLGKSPTELLEETDAS